jgi:hypothetical protein
MVEEEMELGKKPPVECCGTPAAIGGPWKVEKFATKFDYTLLGSNNIKDKAKVAVEAKLHNTDKWICLWRCEGRVYVSWHTAGNCLITSRKQQAVIPGRELNIANIIAWQTYAPWYTVPIEYPPVAGSDVYTARKLTMKFKTPGDDAAFDAAITNFLFLHPNVRPTTDVLDIDSVFGCFRQYTDISNWETLTPVALKPPTGTADRNSAFQTGNQATLEAAVGHDINAAYVTVYKRVPKQVFKSRMIQAYNFGTFTLAQGTDILIKKFPSTVFGRFAFGEFITELQAYKAIQYRGGHSRIRRLYGSFMDQSGLVLVLEFYNKDTVEEAMNKNYLVSPFGGNSKAIMGEIMAQTIVLYKWLVSVGWYHNDIKPENLFIDAPPNAGPRYTVRNQVAVYMHDFDNSRPVSEAWTPQKGATTVCIMSPESLVSQPHQTDLDAYDGPFATLMTCQATDVNAVITQLQTEASSWDRNYLFQFGTFLVALVHNEGGSFLRFAPAVGSGNVAFDTFYAATTRDAQGFLDGLTNCFYALTTAAGTQAERWVPPAAATVWNNVAVTANMKKMISLYSSGRTTTLDAVLAEFLVWV